MNQVKLFFVLSCVVLLSAGAFVYADDSKEDRKPSPLDFGVLFNLNALNLDFESYQGGLGAKIGNNRIAFRLMLDLFYSNSSSAFSMDTGGCFEYHFLDGPVSPYFGLFLSAGYATLKQEYTEDTWTFLRSVPLAFGPVFGMELFLFDFLSVFAEYSVKFEYNISTTEQSIAGSVSSDTETTFLIDTAMGNNSKLGIVLYFLRSDGRKALIRR